MEENMSNGNKILDSVNKYYTNKIVTHGISAKGVDWNSETSQELRFDQLIKTIKSDSNFTLLDYGCGYGALYSHLLKKQFSNFQYVGYDISKEMLAQGQELFKTHNNLVWKNSIEKLYQVDYTIASGIFNVFLENEVSNWETYIFETLDQINNISVKGFSFNMLTSYSDKEFMRDYLYYAEPEKIFAYCKKNFSRNVAILHDYDLYEFTVIVRKEQF